MAAIQTILCPVDFSKATERQVSMAVDLARLFGARLVLHHNVSTALAGAGVGWMYAAEHHGVESESDAHEMLAKLVAAVPEGVAAEGRITKGGHAMSVVVTAEVEGADLVVLVTHGEPTEDHASVTESVLDRSGCMVLALHEATIDSAAPRFASTSAGPQVVLVPTDFSADARPAVDFAFELARRLPVELQLVHVEPAGKTAAAEADRHRLEALVPAELAGRVRFQLVAGDPGREIAAAAERLAAACIVMGEHARSPLRRWFTHDTSHDVLHHAHCPVWFVPSRPA